jgi:hypothetical protein
VPELPEVIVTKFELLVAVQAQLGSDAVIPMEPGPPLAFTEMLVVERMNEQLGN